MPRHSRLFAALLACGTAAASPTWAQSFNCRYAHYTDEQTICAQPDLARLDERLASVFGRVNAALPRDERARLRQAEDDWVVSRRQCGADHDCIAASYLRRMQQLSMLRPSEPPVAVVPAPASIPSRAEASRAVPAALPPRAEAPRDAAESPRDDDQGAAVRPQPRPERAAKRHAEPAVSSRTPETTRPETTRPETTRPETTHPETTPVKPARPQSATQEPARPRPIPAEPRRAEPAQSESTQASGSSAPPRTVVAPIPPPSRPAAPAPSGQSTAPTITWVDPPAR